MDINNVNPSLPIQNLEIGSIIEVDGGKIIAELNSNIKDLTRIFEGNTYYIGQYGSIVKIHFGRRILYGYVNRLRMKSDIDENYSNKNEEIKDARIIEFSLFGEGEWSKNELWSLNFQRGISNYPLPQQKVYLTPVNELKDIFTSAANSTNLIHIGNYSGSEGTKCLADLNELLGKHSAILGSTGSGKSGAVTVVLKSILEKKIQFENWHPRIVILDPHNEYSEAFKISKLSKSFSVDNDTLYCPYWLLSFKEMSNLLLDNSASKQETILKDNLIKLRVKSAEKFGLDVSKITVDAPIPYSIKELIENIKKDRPAAPSDATGKSIDSLIFKIESLINDKRYNFLMNDWISETDDIEIVFNQFFCNEFPVHIIDLSGIPNDVAGIVCSVIARTLFNLKVWETGTERENNPILLICEEAHRYVPNKGEVQYQSAQDAIKSIAKEGRKYGLSLMLVSQRPSELDSTVLSQANSWIVLRLTNDIDREYVKGILPDTLTGLTKNLSSLRQREAIFVGLAALIPAKIMLNYLPKNERPKSNDIDYISGWQKKVYSSDELKSVITRWRLQQKEI